MNWERMNRKDAQEFYQDLKRNKTFFQKIKMPVPDSNLAEPYTSIRSRLMSKFREATEKIKNNRRTTRSPEYSIDLDMAEEIYRVMSEYGMTVRDAADEEIWIYISVKVIPDLIIERFKMSGIRLAHEDRFYANPRRIYPSMLWWYYHISYQGADDSPVLATRRILINNQSDDISQLVERASSGGYPIRVYKQIMCEYARRLQDGRKAGSLLSRALKLNLVQMQSLEPELMSDGLEAYVCDLFDKVEG